MTNKPSLLFPQLYSVMEECHKGHLPTPPTKPLRNKGWSLGLIKGNQWLQVIRPYFWGGGTLGAG